MRVCYTSILAALFLNFAAPTNPTTAMRPKEVSEILQLDKVAQNHTWKVEPSCATTGDGIFEGLVSSGFFFINSSIWT